jgi:hypothetical protein
MVGIVLNPTTSDHGILFTGHGTADQQSGSNPDTTPAWPVHQSGDVGVLLFNLVDDNDTVATVATPSGWTLAAECHQSSISLYAYTRAATSGSETNPTLDVSSASASDSTYGRLSVFRGATTTLSAAAQTDADSTFDATHDYPSYTPAHDDTVVYLGFGNTTSTITALSTATNFNNTHQYFENNPGGVDAGGGAQFWVQTSATAITGSTVSTTGGNSDSCSVIFALQAAAAGSAIPVKHHHYQGLRQ